MPDVVWVDLDKIDLNEGGVTQVFDLVTDLEASGEVSGPFNPTEALEFQRA